MGRNIHVSLLGNSDKFIIAQLLRLAYLTFVVRNIYESRMGCNNWKDDTVGNFDNLSTFALD